MFSFHSSADSTRKCNRQVDPGEQLIGGLEAKAFAGPVVELVHDAADLRAREGVEIGALGQVLTDESVGVLVESALPGMAGGAKQPWASSPSATA